MEQNRAKVYFSIKSIPRYCNKQSKKWFLYCLVIFHLGQVVVPAAGAVVLSLPPSQGAINRLSPSEQNRILRDEHGSYQIRIGYTSESIFDSKLYTELEIDELHESIFNQLNSGSDMQDVINTLRAGQMDSDIAFRIALVLSIWYLLYVNGVDGFMMPGNPFVPRNHWGNLNKDGRPPYYGGYGYSTTNIRTPHAMDPKRPTYTAKRVRNAYNQIPTLWVDRLNCSVPAWDVAKHVHHSRDFEVDPTKYGMTDLDLENIAKVGLINHINQGGKAPNKYYIRDLQLAWKRFAEDPANEYRGIQTVMGFDCGVVKNPVTRMFLSANARTGRCYTGYELTPSQSERHELTGIIGRNYNKNNNN